MEAGFVDNLNVVVDNFAVDYNVGSAVMYSFVVAAAVDVAVDVAASAAGLAPGGVREDVTGLLADFGMGPVLILATRIDSVSRLM